MMTESVLDRIGFWDAQAASTTSGPTRNGDGAGMAAVPLLDSGRLRLRGWTSSDADALRRIYGDPVTMRYIGEGLATEAARLAAAWVWETLEVDRLIHLIRPDNHASIRVAEKLGAAFDHRMDVGGTSDRARRT